MTTNDELVLPLRLEEVPDELKCAICCGIPLVPVVTPCDHVFCADCLERTVYFSNNQGDDDDDTRITITSVSSPSSSCPVCRQPFIPNQVRPLAQGTPLAYRIWSGIAVKCAFHERGCAWTGSIADAEQHSRKCVVLNNNQCINNEDSTNSSSVSSSSLRSIGRVSRTTSAQVIQQLKEDKQELQEKVSTLESKISHQESALDELKAKHCCLQDRHAALQNQHDEMRENPFLELDVLVTKGSNHFYNFDRSKVVPLSRLIARYLKTGAPPTIDGNRIFNCVRNCYVALENSWQDNPDLYYVHVRMLLTTCAASQGWFTDMQMSRIHTWIERQGWS